jgi:hypothetical protein
VKTLAQSLSLNSGAVLIAIASAGLVWLLCVTAARKFRWLWVFVVPLTLSYSLYWLPVWLGADASEYGPWAGIAIGGWFLAGAISSGVVVIALRGRTR